MVKRMAQLPLRVAPETPLDGADGDEPDTAHAELIPAAPQFPVPNARALSAADLIHLAERAKRNREIILRTPTTKASAPTPRPPRAAVPPRRGRRSA
jgi:hypothetical protein